MKAQISTTTWLEYDDAGQGIPLVLLHAFPLSRQMWKPQIEAFSSQARVIMPDLRGFGGSCPFDNSPTLDQMADDVRALLDHLQITEPVILGGLSMGGYLALAFARRFAARLKGLVMADTKAESDNEEAKANRDKMIEFAMSHSASEFIEQLLPKLVSEKTQSNRPDVVAEIRRIATAQSAEGIAGALKVLRDRPDASPGLADVKVRTLVIVGDDDTLTPPKQAELLASRIRSARLQRIADAGHLSNLEQPQAFNRAVTEFVESF